MKAKVVLGVIVLVIFAAVIGPFLAHLVSFVLGSIVTIALVGGATYGGYHLGRAAERRQLPRGY